MQTNDVVRLHDGSVGVVGEAYPSPSPGSFVCHFNRSHLVISDSDIDQILAAPEYNVGDQVTVLPYGGEISQIDGDTFTVQAQRHEKFDFGPITWVGEYVVPRWRIIQDNDPRIQRIW